MQSEWQIHFHTRFHHGNRSSFGFINWGRGKKNFDLRPRGIINMLDLLKPIYGKTAAYGHFGREEQGFNWELTDKQEKLKEFCL